MDKQAILENFVTATRGKGQAKHGKACSYFPDGHPGCAIGCQPGFREKFEHIMEASDTIVDRLHGDVYDREDGVRDQLRSLFGVENDGDVDFLGSLQELHDETEWVDDSVSQDFLDDFCKEFDLAHVVA